MAALRVARRMAAARELRPDAAAVDQLRERALGLVERDHVLVEAQLAAGAQHAPDLGQRRRLVGDAAEHEADHRRVHRVVVQRQGVGERVEQRDRHEPRRLRRPRAQRRLGLDRDHLGDRSG